MYNPSQSHVILVPYDFSDRADCALAHAKVIAATAKDQIALLHVYNNESKARAKKLALSLKDLNTELSKLAESVTASTGIQVDYMLEEGSIFEIIPAVVRRLDARLLVMGTHGIQGMQHITGANILKIAEESPVPDIIVQGKRPNEGGYRTIVFPIDSTRESKQKTFQTAAMARIFNAQVLVFAANESDAFVRQQVNLNIQFAERTFDQNQVRYELHYEDVKGPSFVKQIMTFAESRRADLIVIMTGQDRDLLDIFSKTPEENIINNPAQIAVMCVDPLAAHFGAVLGS